MKEHASITLMASAASQAALATEALAAQELFYGGYPNKAAGIFIVITSQLIGFGLTGLLRDVLIRPTHMLWPMNLPITSLLGNCSTKAFSLGLWLMSYRIFAQGQGSREGPSQDLLRCFLLLSSLGTIPGGNNSATIMTSR